MEKRAPNYATNKARAFDKDFEQTKEFGDKESIHHPFHFNQTVSPNRNNIHFD